MLAPKPTTLKACFTCAAVNLTPSSTTKAQQISSFLLFRRLLDFGKSSLISVEPSSPSNSTQPLRTALFIFTS